MVEILKAIVRTPWAEELVIFGYIDAGSQFLVAQVLRHVEQKRNQSVRSICVRANGIVCPVADKQSVAADTYASATLIYFA